MATVIHAQPHVAQLEDVYRAQMRILFVGPHAPAYLQWLALAHACDLSPGMCWPTVDAVVWPRATRGMYQYQLGTAAMFRQNAPHGRDLVNGWINALALVSGLGAPEALVADFAEAVAPQAAALRTASELSSGGGSTVQIFRNVDAREFDSIAATGKFGIGPGQMEGKWFAIQGAHADQWGQLLNGGQGLTVETNIPKTVAGQLFFHAGKPDGIEPGYYANEEQLNLINQFMDGIRLWP